MGSAEMTTIPLKDGTEYEIEDPYLSELLSVYAYDYIENQLKKMRLWCISNPAKRKTKRGVRRFITTWLGRSNETRQQLQVSKSEQAGDAVFGGRGTDDLFAIRYIA